MGKLTHFVKSRRLSREPLIAASLLRQETLGHDSTPNRSSVMLAAGYFTIRDLAEPYSWKNRHY
jgi:hypothetical protein